MNNTFDCLAPIIIFVYNRPWHTQQTIEALQKNDLAGDSELFIYSDAPKNEKAKKNVSEVREYIKTIDGFKKVTIIVRERNLGLADSIIDGVTAIINQYGIVIVLEDDIVTSPFFLKFMNEALEFYKDKKKVWHISGWNYPLKTGILDEIFLWRLMNCWGWATWKEKWKYFDKNVDKAMIDFSKSDIKRFNLDGFEPYWNQVIANKKNVIDSWAVFWYISIFKADGLCLNPAVSFVKNIGLDGSGTHCEERKIKTVSLNENIIAFQPVLIKENIKAVKEVQNYLKITKISFRKRVTNKLFNIFL